ncbi:MAG: hypothetical protein KQH63_14825 [Desulfobulbaceae bacterium]|nr:hypothetical protein [Desulfobulbaceae bacterium]
MKLMNRKIVSTIALSAMVFGVASTGSAVAATKYQGKAYVAGMGGHFADAALTVDPTAATPITITSLEKIDIGTGSSHPVHDARIDAKDKNVMYWSTYKLDHDATTPNATHVGASNLTTGEVIIDKELATPGQVAVSSKMYCASGQNQDYFFPITMSNPGYVDVIEKKSMKRLHSVFLEGTDADFKVPYKYLHGTTSPDMKQLLITANESDNPSMDAYGTTIGKMHMVVLDTDALVDGKVKVVAKGVADGNKKSTISFRQYYSPDGSLIANATGDILFILDAKTLEVKDAETVTPNEQLHDAIFTPDGKYVIATSRTKRQLPGVTPKDPNKLTTDEYLMDGHLKLYDVKAGKFIGNSTSTCLSCHDNDLGTGEDAVHAVLCGLDVNWK